MRTALASVVVLAPLLAIAACVGDDPSPTANVVAPPAGGDGGGDNGDGSGQSDGGGADADAAPPPAKPCDPAAPFEIVANVLELNVSGNNDAGAAISSSNARLSPDQRTVYLASNRASTLTKLMSATRASTNDSFGAPAPLLFEQPPITDLYGPAIGTDPDTLLFTEFVTNSNPNYVAYAQAQRAGANWGNFVVQTAAELGLGKHAGPLFVSRDLLTLVFDGEVAADGGVHRVLFQDKRASKSDTFTKENRTEIVELDSDFDQVQPVLSADELTLYFATNRATPGNHEIWMARRDTPSSTWKTPSAVAGVGASSKYRMPTWVSDDQCTLYFDQQNDLGEPTSIYKAVRTPK